MLDNVFSCLFAIFQNPSLPGILLALIITAAWLACYKPPLLKKPWLWAVFAGSAIITIIILCLIQTPLLTAIRRANVESLTPEKISRFILILALPGALITGLIQEGAKLTAIVIYWWRDKKKIDPKFGLVLGAMAGAGFGLLEAQLIYNTIFTMNWSWEQVQNNGIIALTPFIERFFFIGFHIAASALAGYGLAIGKGWLFYLLVSLIHAAIYYSSTFLPTVFSMWLTKEGQLLIIEIFIAACTIGLTFVALRILWKKSLKR